MNGQEIKQDAGAKDLLEHAAIALEEVHRIIEKVRKGSSLTASPIGMNDCGTVDTSKVISVSQNKLEKMNKEVSLALGECPTSNLEDSHTEEAAHIIMMSKDDDSDSLDSWEPQAHSDSDPDSNDNTEQSSGLPPYSEDDPANDFAEHVVRILLESSMPPPYPTDSENSDSEDAKVAAIVYGPKRLTKKRSGSREPSSDSGDDYTEDNFEYALTLRKANRELNKLKKEVSLVMGLPDTSSENDVTEDDEDEVKEARLFEEVDRRIEKLLEKVSLAEGVPAEPTVNRARLSKDMDRIFEKLNKKKSTENKEDSVALGEPPTGSKK